MRFTTRFSWSVCSICLTLIIHSLITLPSQQVLLTLSRAKTNLYVLTFLLIIGALIMGRFLFFLAGPHQQLHPLFAGIAGTELGLEFGAGGTLYRPFIYANTSRQMISHSLRSEQLSLPQSWSYCCFRNWHVFESRINGYGYYYYYL